MRKTSDGTVQEISNEVYEAMVGQHCSKRAAPSSGITGLASAKEEDSEIEWGDMDPEAARNLQSEMVKAYKALKPRQLARLDHTTQTFEATPHTKLPPPSCEPSLPDTITMDNLKQITTQYHEQTAQPSIEISNHVTQEMTSKLAALDARSRISNLTLQSLESEQQRRTVLIHNVPPFSTKAVIVAGLTWDDIRSISSDLLTSSSCFLKVILFQEYTCKTFFTTFRERRRYFHTPDREDAVLKCERDLPFGERIERQPLMAFIDFLASQRK